MQQLTKKLSEIILTRKCQWAYTMIEPYQMIVLNLATGEENYQKRGRPKSKGSGAESSDLQALQQELKYLREHCSR